MTRSKLLSEKAWRLNKNKWDGILALSHVRFSLGVRMDFVLVG